MEGIISCYGVICLRFISLSGVHISLLASVAQSFVFIVGGIFPKWWSEVYYLRLFLLVKGFLLSPKFAPPRPATKGCFHQTFFVCKQKLKLGVRKSDLF